MNKITLSSLITSLAIMANLLMPAVMVSALDYETCSYAGTQAASGKSGTFINGIKISRQLINQNYNKGRIIKPQYIVIHDTDNRRYGADAQANRNYFAYQVNAKASAHYIVDQDSIIQALEDNWYGWHLGDKVNPRTGNNNSIAIELCVNIDNNFNKTLENGIALTKYLMKKYDLPAKNVIRHYDVTGKICPRMMIVDKPYLWDYFKASLENNSFSVTAGNKLTIKVSGTKKLNVRQGPGTNYSVIGFVLKGEIIEILSSEGNWYKIQYSTVTGKKQGYILKTYVKFT